MPKLTKTYVESLPAPVAGQKIYFCSSTPGFGVRVTANGAKSYIVQRRIAGTGKDSRYTISPCNLIGTEEARKRALAILLDMHDGKNPQAEKKKRQAHGITLREVMQDYIDNKRTKHGPLRPSSKTDIIKCVEKQFSDWADKPITNITREACVKRFRDLSATAPISANQAFRNLIALCNWARETNAAIDGTYPILPINPVVQAFKSVKWNNESAREERIPLNKIGEVWNLLMERTNTELYHVADAAAAHLVMFMILTGTRIGESSALRWENVRLDDEVPNLTLTETKNHNVLTIPLSRELHEILSERYMAKRKNEEYVFPSRSGTKVPHMQDARGTMEKVSAVAGLRLSNHDLRRTFVACALECNVEMWQAEILTNHIPASITLKHYTETKDLRYLLPQVQRVATWITEQARIAK